MFARYSSIRPEHLLLGLALAVGAVLRAAPAVATDFPLLDGGLFVTMAHDLRDNGFALPLYSAYNAGDVPFAYPPLGLYILAAIPGDPIVTERWLPVVYSVAAIPAVFLVAREVVGSPTIAGLSALAFAVMPITWTLEGAGVTRGLGLLLLLVSIWRFSVLVNNPSVSNAVGAGMVAGLAVLSHPGITGAGFASVALLFAVAPSTRRLAWLVASGAVALAIATPWVVRVLVTYGSDAFVTASTIPHPIGEEIVRLLTVGPTWIEPVDLVGALAVLGIVILARRRDWLLPAWALLLVFVPGANGRNAALVWAMLAATGAITLAPWLRQSGLLRSASAAAFAWLLIAALSSGYQRYTALPGDVRAAMSKAGAETPPGTRFAIVATDAGMRGLAIEWFPTISGRISLGTHMGLEWTNRDRFMNTRALDREFQEGRFPSEVDAVFTIGPAGATWTMGR